MVRRKRWPWQSVGVDWAGQALPLPCVEEKGMRFREEFIINMKMMVMMKIMMKKNKMMIMNEYHISSYHFSEFQLGFVFQNAIRLPSHPYFWIFQLLNPMVLGVLGVVPTLFPEPGRSGLLWDARAGPWSEELRWALWWVVERWWTYGAYNGINGENKSPNLRKYPENPVYHGI